MLSRPLLFILLCLLLATPTVRAQIAGPGELPAMSAATRAAVVDSLTAVIDSVYVLEEPAKRIVARLRENLADGAYDTLTDPAEFARRLFEDAQAVNHDGHFGIFALPPLDPELVAARQERDPADVEREQRIDRALNFGFEKAEILPGGIGYVKFNRFDQGDEAFATATAAMNFVGRCSALILDLRDNGGGAASMIRLLAGYLFAEDTHLINWDIRARGKTVQSYSADYVPGPRLLDQPVYVLTSGRTFSAAEEFTFDLKHTGRATIVGETTGGGGHTVSGYDFAFDGFRMMIRVPFGRAYDPKTNEGWEGVGVAPDIAVPADQALAAAQADALQKLLESEEDEQFRARYAWVIKGLRSELEPYEMSTEKLAEYVGDYGPRHILSDNGQLYYQRDDRPRYPLVPMDRDLFRVGTLDYFRLTFGRDDDGRIVKIIGLYDDGRTDENPRGEG